MSLKQYLRDNARTQSLQTLLDAFGAEWVREAIPARNLLLHNLVVQCDARAQARRLVVIDGLGWPNPVSLARFFPFLARSKSRRRIRRLQRAVELFLARVEAGDPLGQHGWLEADRRERFRSRTAA